MRKLLLIFVTISLSVYSAFAQEHFYSVIEGETQYYTCFDENNVPVAYYSLKSEEMVGIPGDCSVNYLYIFTDSDKKPLFSDEGRMNMQIVLTPTKTSSYMFEIKKATAIQDLITLGDISSLPTSMNVGDDVPQGVINVHIKKINATFTISDRKVVAVEDVTTEAGTFNCYKLNEKQTTKVLISSKDYYFTSWYAKGVGCVKQVIYDKKGNIARSIELTKID